VNEPRRILLIRRDNIGDLVLTTPLIRGLRARFPAAWIGVLGNSYNAPVLAAHPDVNAVFAYDKVKHQPDRSRLAVMAGTAGLLLRLRAMRIDIAILAGPGVQRHAARLAAWVRPRAVLGFVKGTASTHVTLPVPYGDGAQLHEAEDVYRLGEALAVGGVAGPCLIAPDVAQMARFKRALADVAHPQDRIVAVHISARRLLQRWPAGNFAALVRGICARGDVTVVLLWAPGPADHPRHPGDDEKAAAILAQLGTATRCLAWPTATLAELSGALAACDLMVCADGGAMHMAAALGVPVAALFGDSPVARWRPWGVRHEVLRAASGSVSDIEVTQVRAACERLLGDVR
jgi:ADP-heptose:LPS heptosyltransferase